jgi:hypothetical protein
MLAAGPTGNTSGEATIPLGNNRLEATRTLIPTIELVRRVRLAA